MKCPAVLGTGVKTKRAFCDMLTGEIPGWRADFRAAAQGGRGADVRPPQPSHLLRGEVRAKKAYAEYTATVGALAPAGELLAGESIYSTFRTEADLVDRVDGGAGPGGVKAVAPTGTELITVSVPADVTQVSILGERLVVKGLEGDESFVSPGRPIAVLSNANVEYTPARRRPRRRPPRRSGEARRCPPTAHRLSPIACRLSQDIGRRAQRQFREPVDPDVPARPEQLEPGRPSSRSCTPGMSSRWTTTCVTPAA